MIKALMPISQARTAYDLLTDICAIITEDPKRYNQRIYLCRLALEDRRNGYLVVPACGTIGCVAGWAVALKDPNRGTQTRLTVEVARNILGLSPEQAALLFNFWAVPITIPPQTRDHAQAGVKHIQKYQALWEAQLKATRLEG